MSDRKPCKAWVGFEPHLVNQFGEGYVWGATLARDVFGWSAIVGGYEVASGYVASKEAAMLAAEDALLAHAKAIQTTIGGSEPAEPAG